MAEEKRFRFTRYDRPTALLAWKRALAVDEHYRVGISTDMIPFIEIDSKEPVCIEARDRIARWIAETFSASTFILETERGFHLVPCIVLFPYGYFLSLLGTARVATERAWREYRRGIRKTPPRLTFEEIDRLIEVLRDLHAPDLFFEDFLELVRRVGKEMLGDRYRCVDDMHLMIAEQRHNTTLRISPKVGKKYDIRYIGYFDPRTMNVKRTYPARDAREAPCRRLSMGEVKQRIFSYLERSIPDIYRKIKDRLEVLIDGAVSS